MQRMKNKQQEELATPAAGRRSSRARKPSQKVLAMDIPKGSDSSDTSIFDMESDEEVRCVAVVRQQKRARIASSRAAPLEVLEATAHRPKKRRVSAATHRAQPLPTVEVSIMSAIRVPKGVQLLEAAAVANASISPSTPIKVEEKPLPLGFEFQTLSSRKKPSSRKQKSPKRAAF